METPKKRQKSRRQVTTAATDKNDTVILTVEDEKRHRVHTQVHGSIDLINKKLRFQSENQKLYALKTKNQAQIQANYRRSMIDYLNRKFAEATKQPVTNIQEQKIITEPDLKAKQTKILENIAYLFQEIMHHARQFKATYKITQFQLGSILKNMNFIKSLLNERLIVSNLYNDISEQSIQALFMFLVHFYVIHNESKLQENLKAMIIHQTHNLFQSEGLITPYSTLEKLYQESITLGKKQIYKPMRINRQNRPTFKSYNYSLNRKKK